MLILIFTMVAMAVFVSPALCATQSKKQIDKKASASNLHVVSDEMIAERGQSMVEFIGNVKVTREDSELIADSVKVFFHTSKTQKAGQSNVQKIIATGNVEYTAGDRKAFADKIVYTSEDEVLILTGKSPKLLTGKSYVTGKKITLFRLEDRVMVESEGKKRVEAFFDAQDQNPPTSKTKE